jgi:hypothetical protein
MSRNYNGYLPAVTYFITIFNFGGSIEFSVGQAA